MVINKSSEQYHNNDTIYLPYLATNTMLKNLNS